MNEGPFGQDSRPALIGAKYAEAQGKGAEYHQAVFDAYWMQAREIEGVDHLVAIAVEVGLDGEAFRTALSDPALEALVDADIEMARAYGLNGVPALVFENRYLLSGAQPVATMRQVCDRLIEG